MWNEKLNIVHSEFVVNAQYSAGHLYVNYVFSSSNRVLSISLQMCGTFRPFERLFPFSGILECLPDQTQDIASHVLYQKLRQV